MINITVIERELCRKAVRLIYENLLKVYENGSDIEARQKMQQAAFYAGRAFTRGGVGYVHAIGHAVGGLYGTPHGLAMAIFLPYVMRAYGDAACKKLAELSDVCRLTTPQESDSVKADAFIGWIEELKVKMQIPQYPEMIRKTDVKQIAKWAEKEANPLYPTPEVWNRREFERFLYGEMVKKLSEFQTLTAKRETVNPKLTALNMELARVEDEIEKLLNTLTGANAVLLSYANSKIEELDTPRQALTKEIAALSAETMSPEQIERLSVYLNQWEEIDFEDRRQVADGLISQIRATDEHVSIEWKI